MADASFNSNTTRKMWERGNVRLEHVHSNNGNRALGIWVAIATDESRKEFGGGYMKSYQLAYWWGMWNLVIFEGTVTRPVSY